MANNKSFSFLLEIFVECNVLSYSRVRDGRPITAFKVIRHVWNLIFDILDTYIAQPKYLSLCTNQWHAKLIWHFIYSYYGPNVFAVVPAAACLL